MNNGVNYMPEDTVKSISNLEIHKDYIIVSVNPKLYTLDIIYSAAYALLDKVYVVLEGDPNEEILVELRSKTRGLDLEELGRDFNNELINFTVFKHQSESNREIKEAIVKKSLETNSEEYCSSCRKEETNDDSGKSDEETYLDDPLGIAKPWEESHKEDE
jgi:His-Xaa-Ser system protein HxsD